MLDQHSSAFFSLKFQLQHYFGHASLLISLRIWWYDFFIFLFFSTFIQFCALIIFFWFFFFCSSPRLNTNFISINWCRFSILPNAKYYVTTLPVTSARNSNNFFIADALRNWFQSLWHFEDYFDDFPFAKHLRAKIISLKNIKPNQTWFKHKIIIEWKCIKTLS